MISAILVPNWGMLVGITSACKAVVPSSSLGVLAKLRVWCEIGTENGRVGIAGNTISEITIQRKISLMKD